MPKGLMQIFYITLYTQACNNIRLTQNLLLLSRISPIVNRSYKQSFHKKI
jgi:hypothetical protein